MASAFNFNSLRSLKLRFCPGWEMFLKQVASLSQPIQLKSLEIQSNTQYNDEDDEAATISEFLDTIEGLEDLYICTSSPSDALVIWRTMVRHKSTLKKFVHHQRSVSFETEYPNDLPDLSFVPDNLPLLNDRSQNPFSSLDLECLGMCCRPKYLKPIISPLTSKTRLKILHIRESGSDLKHLRSRWIERPKNGIHDSELSNDENNAEFSRINGCPEITRAFHKFAQWAFGARGFPSLQVLAYGDFSYNGRYKKSNALFCRDVGLPTPSERNYRRLTKADKPLWDMLHQHTDILQACPTDLLLEEASL
ncbi:hypothetical protein BDW59DRAFT_129607 [Aspergillus cavernicola]|uniref:Uncharacterized protein n=1 Tax=Aspergillus cavernicola TaxID=176166 RepID=A0ABR4HT81_9EURO